MNFYSDYCDFQLMEKAAGHTDSTARIDILHGGLVITCDADCPGPEGRYSWSIERDDLILTRITYACEARSRVIEGRWNRF
ncbi:MAG: hypothetical protein JRJ85_09360 [Deltaproteobacteria bacterium]|nr:hypothetical protein [Deltaproteobacteria bacterium]